MILTRHSVPLSGIDESFYSYIFNFTKAITIQISINFHFCLTAFFYCCCYFNCLDYKNHRRNEHFSDHFSRPQEIKVLSLKQLILISLRWLEISLVISECWKLHHFTGFIENEKYIYNMRQEKGLILQLSETALQLRWKKSMFSFQCYLISIPSYPWMKIQKPSSSVCVLTHTLWHLNFV